MVHGLLKDVPAYETVSLSGICAAGMAALKYAFNALRCGDHRHAVAPAAENASAVLRKEAFQAGYIPEEKENFSDELAFGKDFLRWMLSDGAGAVYLSTEPHGDFPCKILWIDLISYANEMPACMYAGAQKETSGSLKSWKNFTAAQREKHHLLNIHQDVKLLNEYVVHYCLEKSFSACLKKHPLAAGAIDFFLSHYSSQFFREKVYQGLCNIGFEIPFEKWFSNLSECGNTGSASIYIMLDEFLRTHRLPAGKKILCHVPESGRFSAAFMLLETV